jgi:putative transposase
MDCANPLCKAFVERGIQTLKHEVLIGFCGINQRHLDPILQIGADRYNHRKGHSGRDHLPPVRDEGDPPVVNLVKHKLVCHAELGGHLKAYRAAA